MGTDSANKATLVDRLSRELNLSSRDTTRIVDAVLESIRDELSSRGRIRLKGFGIFTRRVRKGRLYRHPVTSRDIEVPDRETIVFKPSERLIGAASPPQVAG
jgi:nucleoid DNA-binding protein